MKKISFFVTALLALGAMPAFAASSGASAVAPGQLIKGEHSSAVYYVDSDLSRHAFPNEHVYDSWYKGFGGVTVVPDDILSQFPLTGLVPYKAAARLVKLQTDPKVYAVDDGGVLRWVKTEAVAKALYGDHWNQMVDDMADSFFANYTVGAPIDSTTSFHADEGSHMKDVAANLRVKRFHDLKEHGAGSSEFEHQGFGHDRQAVCQDPGTADAHTIYIAQPAVAAHLEHGDTEGACTGDHGDDVTPPAISGAEVTGITATGATVEFTTNESSTAKVYYSTSTPVDTSTAPNVASATSSDDHSLSLTGLTPNTAYHAVIEATDGSGNVATSPELTFTTAMSTDTTAPVIQTVTVDGITQTAATVHVTTDENTTAKVYYSTTTPVDVATAAHADDAVLATTHGVALSGLAAGTTYHVLVVVSDASGNVTTGTETSFATSAAQ